MLEQWKQVPGHDNYQISDLGRLRKSDTGRVLKPGLNTGGYYHASISLGSRTNRMSIPIHRMVAAAFIPNPDNLPMVLHNNGDQLDNRVSNLRWGSHAENMADRREHGNLYQLHKTHCPRGHEYTESNTYRSPSRPNKRNCITCGKEATKRYQLRKKDRDA